MKRLLTVLTYTIMTAIVINAQTADLETLDAIELPIVQIDTDGGEEPTCEYVSPPEGAFGESITNATKVPGRVTVRKHGTIIYDSGDYVKSSSGMTVKIRGNTSAYGNKKPFKIKLQKKGDMLARGDSKYNDKNWVLLNSAYTLNSMAGLAISSLMKTQWVPQYTFVNLVFNGNYRGIYILIEAVERNEKCRINVDENEGYIVELDPYWWKEDISFDTPFTDITKKYTFKYPDADDITPEQVETIQTCISRMEESIADGTYPDHINVESFARWLLAHDILGTWDSAGSNIFMTRKDAASKLEMGNLWDFDTITQMEDDWARVHTDYFYYSQLFNSSNREFVKTYKALWKEVKTSVFDNIDDILADFATSEEAAAIDRSYILDNQRWQWENTPVETQINSLRQWFASRKQWLDNAITAIDDSEAGISEINNSDNAAPYVWYDITGRRVDSEYKGLVISNGKKLLRR